MYEQPALPHSWLCLIGLASPVALQIEFRNNTLEHEVKSANNKVRLLEDELDRTHEELARVKKELAETLKSLEDV